MRCGELINILEKEIPLEAAEGWDNPGLQVGRRDAQVNRVYIALDATDEVIAHAVEWGADLLLTHHPLLIGAVKKINSDEFHGRKILEMAEKHLAHYAMHTNYDVCRMGRLCGERLHLLGCEVLEKTGEAEDGTPTGIGLVGYLPRTMTLAECCEYVRGVFSLDHVKVFGDTQKKVYRAAICPGSGKSLMHCALEKGVDVYITGDLGHHDGMDALDQGLSLIDAGHYGMEHIFIPEMERYLQLHFPQLEVRTEPLREPFTVI